MIDFSSMFHDVVAGCESAARGGTVGEVIERGNAIRLRPYAHCPRPADVIILLLDIDLAVQSDANAFPGKFHSQRMPLVLRHGRVDILDGVTSSVLRVVERNIVFQRVGSRDVIVFAVFPAPDHAACGILAARDRLELDFDGAVLDGRVALDAPRERSASRLLEYVRGTGCRVVL